MSDNIIQDDDRAMMTNELECLLDYTKGKITFAEYQKQLRMIRKEQEKQLQKYGMLEEGLDQKH